MSSLLTQVLAGLCWILYGSFFEWFWHKYWMHSPRTPKMAFEGHTLQHHGFYKGDNSYFVPEEDDPHHILLKPYSLPLIVLIHLPIMYLIDRYLLHHTMVGGVVAIIGYFLVYEYMHWNMHVPRGHWVERHRWFLFLRQHHKLHHKYMQYNFCVLFPLADWVLGSLITDASLARRRAEREDAIANGIPLPGKRSRRRARFGRTTLAARFVRFKTRRVHRIQKGRKLPKVRELLQIGSNRRNR